MRFELALCRTTRGPTPAKGFFVFVKEAFGSFRQTGTFVPAQPHLAQTLASAVVPRDGMTLVELGAGEGCLTRAIVRRLEGFAYRFVIIELSGPLLRANYEALRNGGGPESPAGKAGHLQFVEADAQGFEQTLNRLGVEAVDTVVSSLPLFYFRPETRQRLLAGIRRRLRADGLFLQYRYTPRGAAELEQFFTQVQRRFVMNFLPAWVFTGRNGRHADPPPKVAAPAPDPAGSRGGAAWHPAGRS